MVNQCINFKGVLKVRGSFQLSLKVSTLTSFELDNLFWIQLNLVHANNDARNW